MTDRELLELAAKAAGYKGEYAQGFGSGDYYYQGKQVGILMYFDDGHQYVWNPLESDKDALRLAVKLGMDVKHYTSGKFVVAWVHPHEEIEQDYSDDPYAATRRAITRAAAEIGRAFEMHDSLCTCNRCAFGQYKPEILPMTPEQFKPIAEHHGLSIPWLAKNVSKVSGRMFRYWVNGRPGINTRVPDDVVMRMKRLNKVLDKVLTCK